MRNNPLNSHFSHCLSKLSHQSFASSPIVAQKIRGHSQNRFLVSQLTSLHHCHSLPSLYGCVCPVHTLECLRAALRRRDDTYIPCVSRICTSFSYPQCTHTRGSFHVRDSIVQPPPDF